MSMAEIVRRAGLDPMALYRWRFETTPKITDLEAALNVVGLTLRAVPIEPERDPKTNLRNSRNPSRGARDIVRAIRSQ